MAIQKKSVINAVSATKKTGTSQLAASTSAPRYVPKITVNHNQNVTKLASNHNRNVTKLAANHNRNVTRLG